MNDWGTLNVGYLLDEIINLLLTFLHDFIGECPDS